MAGELLKRNEEILGRIEDLRPVGPRVQRVFEDGKRAQLLRGEDSAGRAFAPLAESTRRERVGNGPPLAPLGAQSEIVSRYSVRIERTLNGLAVVASWPMAWVKYHVTGTARMPKRDPGGFRDVDKREALRIVREYVMKGRN